MECDTANISGFEFPILNDLKMAKILITSGPTREFLDPIRYISNQSSGRMGAALAKAVIGLGHEVIVISGPVQIDYPQSANVIRVETTREMETAVLKHFPNCQGVIGAAAPCDFRAKEPGKQKIKKTGNGICLEFEETDDILKAVSLNKKDDQWSVGFALETQNGLDNAKRKLAEKNLDLIVLNGPDAMNSESNQVRVISSEKIEIEASGSKTNVASEILNLIARKLIHA